MGRVPKLSTPADMPADVCLAINVMGNKVRTEILYHLSCRPQTSGELAERVGVHLTSVHRPLCLLEHHGLITADVESGHRRGQTVTWRTDVQKVGQLGCLWVAHATGKHVSAVMSDDSRQQN